MPPSLLTFQHRDDYTFGEKFTPKGINLLLLLLGNSVGAACFRSSERKKKKEKAEGESGFSHSYIIYEERERSKIEDIFYLVGTKIK